MHTAIEYTGEAAAWRLLGGAYQTGIDERMAVLVPEDVNQSLTIQRIIDDARAAIGNRAEISGRIVSPETCASHGLGKVKGVLITASRPTNTAHWR